LGRIKMDQKDYVDAQEWFAQMLIIEPNDPEGLYEMASASYLLGDNRTAVATIEQALALDKDNPQYLRAGAMIHAAIGRKEKANTYLKAYEAQEENPRQVAYLKKRLDDWHNVHHHEGLTVAQNEATMDLTPVNFDSPPAGLSSASSFGPTTMGPSGVAQGGGDAPSPSVAPGKAEDPKEKSRLGIDSPEPALKDDMVVIDSVVMRISSEEGTQKGSNILDKFNVTLSPLIATRGHASGGGTSVTVPGIGSQITSQNPDIKGQVRVYGQGVSFGSVTYALNIANANGNYLEVIGRPTLTTTVGKKSRFFSGDEIKVAVQGNFGGNVSGIPLGNTIEVTPVSVENGHVTLEISMEGTIINKALASIISAGSSQVVPFSTGRSYISTTVRVKLGETIMLAGTNEREEIMTRNGVPGLRDLPFIQYLFGNETTRQTRKAVMYLITPRSYKENNRETRAFFSRGEYSEKHKYLSVFEKKYPAWFKPFNNTVSILSSLHNLDFYYRSGDMSRKGWFKEESLDQTLIRYSEFLYF
jgi:hypothetical protein